MRSIRSPAGRASWFALAAMVVLAAGIFLAWRLSRPARVPLPPAPVAEPGEETIERALEKAVPVDSAAFKQRWIDQVRGVDVSDLDAARSELFLRHANARACTCVCGYTLAACRASDMTCDVSGEAIAALLDSIRNGLITDARGIRARPTAGG